MVEIAVAVAPRLRAGEAYSVDDAGVVEPVGEDRRVAVAERGDHAYVRQVAAADEQRRLASP